MNTDDYPTYISDGRPYAKTGRTLEVIPGALNVDYGPGGDVIGVEILAPLDDVAARIAELEAAARWIPVAERLPDLPETGGHQVSLRVLFKRRDGFVDIGTYQALPHTTWWVGTAWKNIDPSEVVEWMPIPE